MMIKEKLEYQKYFLLKKENEKKVNFIATMRVIFFLMMIFSFVLKYYYYPRFFSFVFLFSLLTFVILVIIHDQYFQKYNYYESYLSILEEYIKREDGTWKVFEETGEEFEENAEDYLKDLDITVAQLADFMKTKTYVVTNAVNDAAKTAAKTDIKCYIDVIGQFNQEAWDKLKNMDVIQNAKGAKQVLKEITSTSTRAASINSFFGLFKSNSFFIFLV